MGGSQSGRAQQLAALALRADAIFDLVLGILLLASPLTALYRLLDLPVAVPTLYAQVGGLLLLGFACLLWVAPERAVLQRAVAGVVAGVNGASGLLILGVLGFGTVAAGMLGKILLSMVGVALLGFAIAELVIIKSPNIRLQPPP
jgi:hypothetical protein